MLISSRSKRSDELPKKAQPLLELTMDQANDLARCGKPGDIRSFILEGSLKTDIPGPVPEEMQSGLSEIFYGSVRRKAIIGLLAPLSIPAIGSAMIRPLNDMFEWGLNPYHMAGAFGLLIFASAIWGNRRSLSIERSFAGMAGEILESGKITSQQAQMRFAEVIFLGRRTDDASRLLASGRFSEGAQEMLVDTIYRYGTEGHARAVLASGYCGPGAFLLESMCRDAQ